MILPWATGRYLSRIYLRWFAIIYFGTMGLVAFVDLTELLRQAAAHARLSPWLVGQLVVLHLPFLSAKLMPFLVLFTSFVVFWKLNRSHELVVMRAVGMSLRQIISPILMIVLFIGCVDLFVMNPVSAVMTENYERIKTHKLRGQREKVVASPAGLWVRHAQGYPVIVVKCAAAHLETQTLQDVMIFAYGAGSAPEGSYHAATLEFAHDDQLVLLDGWYIDSQGNIEKFERHILQNDLKIAVMRENHPRPETMSFWHLKRYIKWLTHSGLNSQEYAVYRYSLLAQIVVLMSMVLLAAAFSFRPLRQQGAGVLIVVGLCIGFALYIIREIAGVLGAGGLLPPLVAAWFPGLISLLAGIACILYQEENR